MAAARKPPATRGRAEGRLATCARRRERLEEQLAEERKAGEQEIRWAAELDVPKTRIAFLAKLDRSRVYQLLGKGKA